ncbi:Alternative oxidase, mitochondrial [Labeo rohita]|uniref:Alternative oxidase, mitochondrial n=1 Tax=Labeo rohita TaxID=84645 RepID=A0ABQ8LBA8_LABRO|nr:Alternative oxidase, mitochondrial [Labeo rohita]
MSLSHHLRTLTVTIHLGLHLPSSTALIASVPRFLVSSFLVPGFVLSPGFSFGLSSRLPFGLLLTFIGLLSPTAFDIPVCSRLDPACTTMSLSRDLNKSLHMDPLASRLVHHVTEPTDTKGSSSFSPGHSADMDTNRTLFRIQQRSHTLEQYTREFISISNYSTLPDCTIIETFCDGVNQPLRARLRREGPRSSLAEFMNFALLCVGSPCTVGDNADAAAPHPARRLVVTPDHDAKTKFSAWIAREMAAVSERAQATMASAEPVHKMAAAPVCAGKRAATVEPIHKMAATAVPDHKMAAAPARAHKMAATAVPVCKMAAAPACAHKMEATAEPVHKMAVKTELRHVTAAISEP